MVVDLGLTIAPQAPQRMRHVSSLDRPIMERFIYQYEDKIESLWYDVRVGKGVVAIDEKNEKLRKMYIGATQRRIDVIIKFLDQVELYLTEIRPHADPGSIGNALTTWFLFKREDPRPVIPCILTDHVGQDIQIVADNFNIKIFQVGAASVLE